MTREGKRKQQKSSKTGVERLKKAGDFLLESAFSPSEMQGLTSGPAEECSSESKLLDLITLTVDRQQQRERGRANCYMLIAIQGKKNREKN